MNQGHSTENAFSVLEKEIESELKFYKRRNGVNKWLISAFCFKHEETTMHWLGILFSFLLLSVIIICYSVEDTSERPHTLLAEFFILLLILFSAAFMNAFNSYLRHNEMSNAFKNLLFLIKDLKGKCKWEPGNYPDLQLPFSPAINLQWTFRDNHLVNLPLALLVQGDVIVIHPGQKAPEECVTLKEHEEQTDLRLERDEVYSPEIEINEKGSFSTPRMKKPLPVKKFVLLKTPYILNVRIALSKALNRPQTFFEKEYAIIKGHYIEKLINPLLLIVTIALNSFRYFYLKVQYSNWAEMILLESFHVILPLLPLKFPICYPILNIYGMGKLITFFNAMKQNWPQRSSKDNDLLVSSGPSCQDNQNLTSVSSWRLFKHLFMAKSLNCQFWLCRTSNMFQTLGSMTSLCCVDKKGLLSWPNPTAEKVFFFKNPSNTQGPSTSDSVKRSASSIFKVDDSKSEERFRITKQYGDYLTPADDLSIKTGNQSFDNFALHESKVEVLDLTHNNRLPFALQFDDPQWKRYLTSLKPLGLNILLNTCNPESQPNYINFCSYLAREALSNEITIPAINRRCLCELSKQIGFVDHASEVFQYEQQLSFFRHVQEDLVRKDKLTRSLNVKKLKCAMPNAVSIVAKDLLTATPQLMSQGTADIIIDLCSEFWDGSDLIPLTQTERKKILDFYHRYSLTSYCTAFAYRPITAPLNDSFSSVYLELPPNYNQFFNHSHISSPIRSWEQSSHGCRLKTLHYLSTDSVFLHEKSNRTNDPQASLKQICNQIFIGMIAMQYQARSDIVRLIERLDDACIRFVHFSKENELRSRVFSEKMGLESGWNCHISLLSDGMNGSKSSSKQSVTQALSAKYSSSSIVTKRDCVNSGKNLKADLSELSQKAFRSHSAPINVCYDAEAQKYLDNSSRNDSIYNYSNKSSAQLSSIPQISSLHNSPEENNTQEEDHTPSENEMKETSHLLFDEIQFHISDTDDRTVDPSLMDNSETSEESDDVVFDMSNRAKLPKGIENIRPHLEQIDNVPLLVSLFTDCTPETTEQMIEIMQEHDEIICCIGSISNFHNMALFIQSDVSIGIQPLYPQICMKKPVIEKQVQSTNISPTEMSSKMNSIACSLTYHRDDPIDIYHLIIEAKSYFLTMRTCFYLMLSCCITLSLTQLFANFLLLPPILTGTQVLWLSCFVIPAICLPIVNTPTDCHVFSYAAGKLVRYCDKQALTFFCFCFFFRFFPIIVVCLLSFGLSSQEVCSTSQQYQLSCHLFTGNLNQSSSEQTKSIRELNNIALYTGQSLITFLLTIYFVLTSVSFVHRNYPVWKKNVLQNKSWFISVILVFIFQSLFTTASLIFETYNSHIVLHRIPYYVWVLICLWVIMAIPVNELVKIYEIKANVRLQKRARLEFGTKLGMNSPF